MQLSRKRTSLPTNFQRLDLRLLWNDHHIIPYVLQVPRYQLLVNSRWRIYCEHHIARGLGNLRPLVRAVDDSRNDASLFYLVTYVFTNFGAWRVVIALENKEEKGPALADYAGLGCKHPLLAAMTVFMLSLVGLSPTLGLVGKFYLFRAVIASGFTGPAIIGVLTSLISACYYLRVVVTIHMKEGEP